MGTPAKTGGYKRILLKLSGEALMGDDKYGIHPPTLSRIAEEVMELRAAGRGGGHRHRRRQHLPRRAGRHHRHGPRERRLHGHARHLHQLPGAAGLAREARRQHPGALGHQDGADRRALHSPPRGAAPREGPHRHLRRRHRQPVLHHRHRRLAARHGDQRRGHPQGDQGRRRVRRRPARRTRRRAATARSRTWTCSRSSST